MAKKTFYFYLIIIAASFLEATIMPFQIVLLLFLVWALVRSLNEGLAGAFFSGLILDLTKSSTLGLSSLIFLLITLVLNLYKGKLKLNYFLAFLPFAFVSFWFFNLLKGEFFLSVKFLINPLLLFFVWPLTRLWWRQGERGTLQLPLKM